MGGGERDATDQLQGRVERLEPVRAVTLARGDQGMEASPVQADLLAEPVVAIVGVGQVAGAIGGATKAGPGSGHGGVQRAPG